MQLTCICLLVSPFTALSTRIEALAPPLLTPAGMNNLELRQREFLMANIVLLTDRQEKGEKFI